MTKSLNSILFYRLVLYYHTVSFVCDWMALAVSLCQVSIINQSKPNEKIRSSHILSYAIPLHNCGLSELFK